MQTSRLAKIVKRGLYLLPLFAVALITVMGIFMAQDIDQTALDLRTGTTAYGQDSSQPLYIYDGKADGCLSLNIYTSRPPKCKTADGTFLPLKELSRIIVVPENK